MDTAGSFDSDDPIGDGYVANAQYWIEIVREGLDRYQQELTDPALLAAIGDCSGAAVVDVGCGEGSFARTLLMRGVATVHGVDSCLPLIQAARTGGDPDERLMFSHADVDTLPISDSTADLVIANRIPHALNNPGRRFHEFARVLRPQGRLLLLSQHPCFYGTEERATAPQSPEEPIDYFGRRIVRRQFSVAGRLSPAPSIQPFYSLSAYVTMITDAGFVITGIDEPHPTPRQFEDPWWATNFTRPMFMIISCTLTSPAVAEPAVSKSRS